MTIENRQVLRFKKWLRRTSPSLLCVGASIYHRIFQFKLEKAYMKGNVFSELAQPSLVLFSCNRCATQFVEDVLARIYEYVGGKYIALNRYLFFFDRQGKHPFSDAVAMRDFMKSEGFFYGQQGPFNQHELFKPFKKVVMVRDPRDLLVSHFYSFTHAHVPRNREFVDKIKNAKEMGIHNYVLLDEHIDYFKQCLKQAITLQGEENVLFYKYEDMMMDFVAFHEQCQIFISGKVETKLSQELNSMYRPPDINQRVDNTRHRRSGAWGQFKTALEPDTIEKLNAIFEEELNALGYPI